MPPGSSSDRKSGRKIAAEDGNPDDQKPKRLRKMNTQDLPKSPINPKSLPFDAPTPDQAAMMKLPDHEEVMPPKEPAAKGKKRRRRKRRKRRKRLARLQREGVPRRKPNQRQKKVEKHRRKQKQVQKQRRKQKQVQKQRRKQKKQHARQQKARRRLRARLRRTQRSQRSWKSMISLIMIMRKVNLKKRQRSRRGTRMHTNCTCGSGGTCGARA